MIGSIRRYNGQSSSGGGGSANPDDYFDTSTHTATEANFLAFLNAGGYYDDTTVVGYKVVLSNSVDYNNGTWVIADVNHDSTNTGQTNCYDLVSLDCFHNATYSSSSNEWRSSTARTWLNNTFYPGFSTDIKSHIMNIKYNSQGTWYEDDKVTIPSYKEVNAGTSSYQDNEGVAYPIFTDNNSRIKYTFGTTSAYYWWTRSRDTGNSIVVWNVNTDGSMYNDYYNGSIRLAPSLRIS